MGRPLCLAMLPFGIVLCPAMLWFTVVLAAGEVDSMFTVKGHRYDDDIKLLTRGITGRSTQ